MDKQYLECGIFANGFARARCEDCGHDFLVACIHRFGSRLNEHVHFHVCAVDGVLEEVVGEECDAAAAASQNSSPRIIFHLATGVNADGVAQVQARLRRCILRAFVGRSLFQGFEATEMPAYQHSGFSVDTSVCIAEHDRAGLEPLPCTSLSTTSRRMPASVSILCGRFFSALSMPASFCLCRATRRNWRMSAVGTKDARSSPARASMDPRIKSGVTTELGTGVTVVSAALKVSGFEALRGCSVN